MPLLNNMTGKLTKNADKLGILAGAVTGAPGGINEIIDNIMLLFTEFAHVPDIEATIKSYFEHPLFKSTALLWLVGYTAKEFGYGKYGKPISKFSEGMFKGLALQHVLFHSTHAGRGSAGNPVTRQMFNRSVVAPNQGYSY